MSKLHPLIILEGPDGAGKTTLANQLRTFYPEFAYHHEGPPPEDADPFLHYFTVLTKAQEQATILDRYAPGEIVYGPVYRGRDNLGVDGWQKLYELVRYCSPAHLLILCLPSYAVCHKAWSSGRDELLTDESDFIKTYNAYEKFLLHATAAGEPWIVYDYTKFNAFGKLIEQVANVMQKAKVQ